MHKGNTRLSFGDLGELIWVNLKIFIIVGIIAGIAAIILALVLPEYYTSTVTIFPAKTTSMPFDERYVRQGNLSDIGEEEEAEQLLQVLHSETLFHFIKKEFDLYDHYNIDPGTKAPLTKLKDAYWDNVNMRRTRYNSIEISVTDRDPEFAAQMANAIAGYADEVMNTMIRERASSSLAYLKEERARLEETLQNYADSLNKYQDMGVVTERERAALIEAYGQSLGRASAGTQQRLEEQIETNKQFGDEYDLMKIMRDRTTDRLARMQSLHDQIKADANIAISHQFIVDTAIPADRKSHPVRWLLVVMIVGATLLMTLTILLFMQRLL